ncbi:hypothetical protein H2199_000162 [Coniosporium tulheliwenetii]|uniref:Uncharacterized protein n=1 Tax=Coniosporium tulheliwenetii TaxID=3383036 RepID=A0ACC2ZPA1_9PEZI|nr:hypothetical protein H2199_000162 [Cladosporium sp. JES 115]
MDPKTPGDNNSDRDETLIFFNNRARSGSPPLPALPKRDSKDGEAVGDGEEEAALGKSPLLTSHRISVGSMDDVNLEESPNSQKRRSRSLAQVPTPAQPPKPVPKDSFSSLQRGLSGILPPVKFPPPPAAPEKTTTTVSPPPPARKTASPFSWFSRQSSEPKKTVTSPPSMASHGRSNTTASLATIGSNQELALGKIDDVDESHGPRQRNSLKDRFKFLRMQEEAGMALVDDDHEPNGVQGGALAGLIGRSASVGFDGHAPPAARRASGTYFEKPMRQPSINHNLAPGTASGISAGPASESAPPVDWDLWQSVVYEGPAAIAMTSSEELNRAIAGGIPQAIRGVVWQVLAESKNEALEGVYRDLVARGTDKERPHMPIPTLSETSAVNGGIKEKESIASSASSIHSDHSTPATSANASVSLPGSPPPQDGSGPEGMAKLAEERKRRAKEEAASIAKLEKTIKRDLGARTSYSKYLMSAGLQDGLFGICKAYALYDDAVGYAQGMNFIAMPLLFNMPEEEAFTLFVQLMRKYNLRDLFTRDMPGLHLHLHQFSRLLEDFSPALASHLHRRGVSPQLYATQWFLTLFAYRFPLQLVLRVYDLVLSEGLESAVLKFGIALMLKNEDALMAMGDMAALTTFLKERLFDAYIDKAPSASSLLDSGFFGSAAGGVDKEVYRADVLVRDACAIKISQETLRAYAAEWRELNRVEKEREAELEGLRSSVAALTAKVRHLEEESERHAREHVGLASEVVRTKIANESLSDENEVLRTRVSELEKIVEKQPEEVESRLREEMEGVMQRNIVVHNENRALEEQLGDMERVLVETKMDYAQLNADHETLKQKWNNISAMLNSQ